MSLIDCITNINRNYPGRKYYNLNINKHHIGYVDDLIINDLCENVFNINHSNSSVNIDFTPNQRQDIENKLELFFKNYFAEKKLNIWRNENYSVSTNYAGETLLLVERAILSYLGITGYGVHINGYVEKNKEIYMWIAKRSLNKSTAPGKLDQIAAGGVPHNVSLIENVIKECEEEASIPKKISQNAKLVSEISYWYDLDVGVRPDTIFNYDLKLPNNFIPRVNDGEVDSFQLININEVLNTISTTKLFKFNSAVVIIDFALRHNIINETNPEFFAINQKMQFLYKNNQSNMKVLNTA